MLIIRRNMIGLKAIKHAIQNWLHLKCNLFNVHDYVIEHKYTKDILKLHCKKCQKKYGVNLKSAVIFALDEDMMLSLSIFEKNLENGTNLQQSPNIITAMKIVA